MPFGYAMSSMSGKTGVEALGLDNTPENQAALEVVRGYCGWHVVPYAICDVTVQGTGLPYLTLPFMFTDSDEVLVYDVLTGGRVYDVFADFTGRVFYQTKNSFGNYENVIDEHKRFEANKSYLVKALAGIKDDEAAGFAAVVKQVAQGLSNPVGVAGEKAGSVQITYNTNESGTAVIGDRLKILLAPYKKEVRA